MAAFDDLIASLGPQGASAWGSISHQLSLEGADQPTVAAAQNTFTSAWNNLSSTFGMNADDALTGAQQYTFAASTAAGSVAMVQGFIGDARQASTAVGALSVVNMFTGSMIGLAVAAGAVSAGVGAVVVAAVALAGDLLQSFLGAPPGVEICPGITVSPTPSWVITCTPFWGTAYSPGQNGWRAFPTDSVWFSTTEWETYGNNSLAPGPTINDPITGQPNTQPIAPSGGASTPIEMLFPEYFTVAASRSDSLAGFHQAFVAAWKANKEYALNGQKVQDDATVLQHTILVWNRAHSNSSTTELSPSSGGYESSIVQTAIASASSSLSQANAIAADRSGFIIKTGPRLVYVLPLTLRIPQPAVPQVGAVQTPTSTAPSAATSTVKRIAVAALIVGAAGAAGIGVWALVTRQSYLSAAKGAWHASGGKLIAKVNPLPLSAEEASSKTNVQTLLFPRDKFSISRAKDWAHKHGYLAYKTDVTEQYIRIRQRPPYDFKKGSFRTISLGNSGVRAVVARRR